MLFYNFNFKGRWTEFKIYFPKRWASFKARVYSDYLQDNRWFSLLLEIIFHYLVVLFIRIYFIWYAFVLNYGYMAIGLIRKMSSYSRQDFFWGFDVTKVLYISDPLFSLHKRSFDKQSLSTASNGDIVYLAGLGFNPYYRNNPLRINNPFKEAKTNFRFNLDSSLFIESKTLRIAQENACNTFFYYTRRVHRFLLLTESPWPLFTSFSAFYMVFGLGAYFSYYEGSLLVFWCGFILTAVAFYTWTRDFLRETALYGRLTDLMIRNMKLAFWLFIVSEALLFVSFFWAFFHVSLEPAIQIGSSWPPVEGIHLDKLLVPTANTLFLLASGAAFTWVQYHFLAFLYDEIINGFVVTIIFSVFFIVCQWHEYVVSGFQLNDSVFGSSLYLLTAFHGAHVIIGSIFIMVSFFRFYCRHFVIGDPVGITLASWYWHFVDVIWLLVFIWVYLWGTWIPSESAGIGIGIDPEGVLLYIWELLPNNEGNSLNY